MKRILLSLFIAFTAISLISAQQIAFPGAEGFGKYAKGARASASPTVYRVTNLNDTGSGSFRDAVSGSNRIIVFDVAGVIKINSRIVVAANNYIAGQTAPGEGITIYGNGFSFSGANNTICRHLRIRMGNIGDSGKDACGISNGSNMIFDHVSVSWGRDETFSISWDNKGTEPTNITIQNSIIAQGLMAHSAGGLIQTNGGVTLYRNAYIDNGTRNNKIKGVNQYVNNVVYNWEAGAYIMGGDSEGESFANAVSNYFIKGPAKGGSPFSVANNKYHLYAADNWHDGNKNQKLDGYLIPQSEYSGGPDFQSSPYAYPILPTWPASVLIDSLLPQVGASLPYSDLLDYYVIDELKSFGKKGYLITNETENPIGTPSQWNVWTGSKRTDSDNDGIPDAWEIANGLNPNLASDAVAIATNGYLNIENYINSITLSNSQSFLRAPLNLIADSTSQNSISLSWFDFTEKEQGYCVEKRIKGVYTEIARTGVNGNIYTITGLNPEQKDTIRIRAFNPSGYSTYSNELIVKTKPIPVSVVDLSTYIPELTWIGTENFNWEKTSANWTNGTSSTTFADNTKVLFANTAETSIDITEPVSIETMVVNSEYPINFQGAGSISGTGSINKTGSGKLSLLTNNTYTGATVLYGGVLEINKLANGGVASSIGASQNYAFNCVLKGGVLDYTGGSVSTDRSMLLEGVAGISVSNSAATVTMNGVLSGTGSFVKSGAGKILNKTSNTYEGETTINEGILELNGVDVINNGVGAANILRLNGGTFKTSGGSNTVDEYYNMNIIVEEGKTSGFEPYRNCQIKSKVSGNGTLNLNISYVREYITGDWSQFSGTLNANGIGSSTDGSQFMLNNTVGIPNARVVTSGNTRIVCWKNTSTMYLGGLSGPSGTYLSGADKQNNASTMTWIVGGAGTDETFNGVINNECSNNKYKGTTTIIKEGSGYWKLTGANIYSGATTVKDGMLIINGTQTGAGKVTVMEDATLAGKGKIPALVEIQSGGTLQPGDPSLTTINFGTLTVGSLSLLSGSTTNMEVNRITGLTDKVAASSSVVLGGTLNLTVTGTLSAGDQFTLFTGSTITGSFNKIFPETPGDGLKWNLSGGILKVDVADGLRNTTNNRVKVYPNPLVDKTQLILDKTYHQLQVAVYDVNAKMIQNVAYSDQASVQLDLSNCSNGSYFVKIKGDNQLNETLKLLKE